MANNIITAKQVRKGDHIKTIFDVAEITITRSGVVANITETLDGQWNFHTAKGYSLGPAYSLGHADATIKLLDRPKPKLTVPTLPNAVVKYTFIIGVTEEPRTAIRDDKGTWRCYEDNGMIGNIRHSDSDFEQLVQENGGFTVIFGGTR